MRLTLDEIVKVTGGRLVAPGSRLPAPGIVTGVCTDTRTLKAGDLFVPLRGPQADGHDFIADAFGRGAVASLCARPVNGLPRGAVLIRVVSPLVALGQIAGAYRRTLTVTVVGITGSVGKTTTAKLCASALARRFRVAATREEWNAEVGVPLLLLGLGPAHEIAVTEMAMRGLGQIAELVQIAAPRIGVVTAIGEAHLEFLGTQDNIARAKGELIAGLPADGIAILNRDDGQVMSLAPLCRGRVVTFGLEGPADVAAQDIRQDASGASFLLQIGPSVTPVRLAMWGRHNVRNALAAAAVAHVLGMETAEIAAGLAACAPPKMRLQPVPLRDILIINDAYNASPASMEAAFDVLAEVGRGRRLVAILGEMKELGADAPRMHRDIGASLARRPVSVLVAVAEGAAPIAEGAAAAGMSPDSIIRTRSVAEAVTRVPALIRSGDVVLVKGSRALELERVVATLVEAGSS